MNKLRWFFILLGLAFVTTGCANISQSHVAPNVKLENISSIYVHKYPDDNSGVNELIADKLRQKGIRVTTNPNTDLNTVDAVLSYIDRWMWDITMYMRELTVSIRDAKTEVKLATGYSMHGSWTRLTQEEMVNEVINNLYRGVGTITPSSAVILTLPINTQSTSASERLKELNQLYKDSLISEEDFEVKKKEILKGL